MPIIARRATDHGSGLGRLRRVVERTFAWLHFLRRLRLRWERRARLHEAFLRLGCALICPATCAPDRSTKPSVHLSVAKLDGRRRFRNRSLREHGEDLLASPQRRPVRTNPMEVRVQGETDGLPVAAARRLQHVLDDRVHILILPTAPGHRGSSRYAL
jgi:hypothetical protein